MHEVQAAEEEAASDPEYFPAIQSVHVEMLVAAIVPE
jgi:hypothetical protein